MKMKRMLTALLTAGMCVSLLGGCGGKEETAGNENEDTARKQETLKVATWDYTSNASVSNCVKAFEESNPDIKIEIVDIPSTDYNTKLNVMLNGGSELDAFYIKDAPTTYDFYQKNQLLDLTEFIEKDGIDLSGYKGVDQFFNLDGKQLAMPVRTDYYVLFYNKDLFDAAGMEYPSNDMTWTEFADMARKLTSKDVYGAHIHTWQTQVQNLGVQDGEHTTMDYDTGYDFFKPYYEMIVSLQDEGVIQDFGALQSGNIHYSSAFEAGNVAMMPMGNWFITTMRDAVANGDTEVTNWGIATMPHPDNVEAGYTIGSATPLAINPASEKQETAWEFIKFMSGEEGAKVLAESGAAPSLSTDEIMDVMAGLDGMPEGLKDALEVKHIAQDRPIGENVTEVDAMLTEEHGLIMLGEISIDEGLAEMAERSKEIQEK